MLYGRAAECARVDELLAGARRGRAGILVVHGEPGMGKTTLLSYAISQAPWFVVRSVRGVPAEHALPFAGLSQLLAPWAGRVDDLPAVQAAALRGALALGPAVAGDRFAVYTAVTTLLAAVAAERPVLICVDDAGLLDPPSAEALLFAGRRLGAAPVAVLLTAEEPEPWLRGLPAVELAGLAPDVAGRLIAAASADAHPQRKTPEPAPPVVAELTRQAGGNPLALAELARLLPPEQLRGRQPLPDPLPAGPGVEALLSRRLAGFDPAALAVLLLAAAADGEEPAALLRAVRLTGQPESIVEEMETAGVLSFAGDRVAFAHPLLRSVAWAGAAPAERRAAHAALATCTVAGRRAWHLAGAALGPAEPVAAALDEAGRQARARSGYAAAAAAHARAAELTPDPARRARRRCAAADAAGLAGDPERALALLDLVAADGPDPATGTAVLRLRGRLALQAGRAAEAATLLSAAARAAPGAEVRVDAALAAFLAGDLGRAVGLLDGQPAGALADLVLGSCWLRMGRITEGLRVLHGAIGRTAEPDRPLEPRHAVFAALVLTWIGRTADARAVLAPALALLRGTGAAGLLPHALYAAALLDARTGALDAAAATAAEAAELAALTDAPLWRYEALGCLALVAAYRGDERACRAHAAEALALRRRHRMEYPRDVDDALGLLALALGDVDAAADRLAEANRPPGQGAGVALGRPTGVDLIEAYVRAQRPVPAAEVERFLRRTDSAELPAHAAAGWRCRALLATGADADAHFRRAVDLYARTELAWEQARTLLAWGERLRRRGLRTAARDRLRAAADAFERMGAQVWAARARAELRATGPGVAAESSTAAGSGVDAAGPALTARESQIATVIAAGASNHEAAANLFISEKTVEMHLTRIYRKLGVRSRSQLVVRLAGQPTGGSAGPDSVRAI